MTDTNDADYQDVRLDNDERILITAYRRIRANEYADLTAKVHRRKLVAIYTTDKWHTDKNGSLREVACREVGGNE